MNFSHPKASNQHPWMITSHLGGGIFVGIYFQMAANASNPKKKYCLDFDDVDIKLNVFWDAEAMCEVIGEVTGHANVAAAKVKVMMKR